jgi:hypothetical protein
MKRKRKKLICLQFSIKIISEGIVMWIKASDYSTETFFHVSPSEHTSSPCFCNQFKLCSNFKTGDQKGYVSAPKLLFSITKDLQTIIKQPSSFFSPITNFICIIKYCQKVKRFLLFLRQVLSANSYLCISIWYDLIMVMIQLCNTLILNSKEKESGKKFASTNYQQSAQFWN